MLACGLKLLRPGGVIFQIVDRSVLLVESAINYKNLPFFIEVKFNT
jgi:hypothetical protein